MSEEELKLVPSHLKPYMGKYWKPWDLETWYKVLKKLGYIK